MQALALTAAAEQRRAAGEAFFGEHAERIARLCHRMAERFARGGRLLAFGDGPLARSDARHVAVEFVHPVIVGKRALPALALTAEGGPLAGQLDLLAEPEDIAFAFGAGPNTAAAVRLARERGCLTLAAAHLGAAHLGAEWELVPGERDPFVCQELVETLYHLLWELVHVFFEHRGLLDGRGDRTVHDAGAASFLYPFLGQREDDLEAVVADVRASVLAKAEEVAALRARTLAEAEPQLLEAAAALRVRLEGGGRVLALGNGGSATDAMDAVADLRLPPSGWPARAAIDLTEDPAVLTAIANDIGEDAIFSRQVIAHGRSEDAVLAFSTSGGSRNVLAALAEARRRGLLTIAFVGYGGGRIAEEGLADHVIAVPSEHIPRIQEAQASAWHVLRGLIEQSTRRVRVRVTGTVQGVGFRPHVHRLAGELALTGWVRNDEHGVEAEVEGGGEAVAAFLARLAGEAPPMAQVERVVSEPLATRGERGFAIAPSARGGSAGAVVAAGPAVAGVVAADALVAPDLATCADCLAELFDAGDRRFRYPFVNCTNCGPRFTIVRGVPYDRPLTTMAGFEMCPACRAEYEDPRDRRFHAQPNACPACGPRARLLGAGESLGVGGSLGVDAVAAAGRLLAGGAVLAVKGLGGYHLAVRADEEAPVDALRSRKRREDRPFALMVADLATARELAHVEDEEAELLGSPARPIVLAPRRTGAHIAAGVAPRARELGLMLPYTPLHHLLLADTRALGVPALVMTSGNVAEEPIAYTDDDAMERLGTIADAFLVHDRPIHMRTDDSVVRAVRVGGRRPALTLRRSRGYVPGALRLPVAARRPLLACGAELKSTFCVARGERAWVSHHIGDLRNWETLRSFREGIEHFERLFAVHPEVLVHDLHPDYLSTAHARERPGDVELLGVQHHHAHLAAVLAEHGESGPAVGAIFDGSGHGDDGTVWGGELLLGGLDGFRRAGHLRPVPLPGGDRAVREPWRMACAWLAEASGEHPPPIPPSLSGLVAPERWAAVARIAAGGIAARGIAAGEGIEAGAAAGPNGAPLTTSVGRLCDAMGALCGLRAEVSYEGQAAIELEGAADPAERGAYPVAWREGQLDPRAAILEALDDLARGGSPALVSARFHRGLSRATANACAEIASASGLSLVVLAGGVFQNRLLLEDLAARLQASGLRVLTPERLPPGDGAISYGQAAIAAAVSPGAAP